MSLISFENASFAYPGSQLEAVRSVTFDVREGEMLAVIGHNGSGKSTLARMMNALNLPTAGGVRVGGMSTADENCQLRIRQMVGMVFQNPDNGIVATIVEEDVAFGPENMGVSPAEIRKRVDFSLHAVGMDEFFDAAPHMLSGGQKQRIAIAGVIAMKPRVLVLDESTAMLDPQGREEVLSVVQRLHDDEGITVVLITHFMEEAARCDRIAVMNEGELTMVGTPREVFAQKEALAAIGLGLPPVLYLKDLLAASGLYVDEGAMSVEGMVDALCQLLQKG